MQSWRFVFLCRLVLPVLPIHATDKFLESDKTFGNQAGYMKFTMTNITPGDPVLWVHTVFVALYVAWGEYCVY